VFLSRANNFLVLFFVFFYKYQNTPDPIRNLQKNWSLKNTDTPEDKSMCFKIQGYFGNFLMLKNRKNQKNPSPKAKDIQTLHQF
jgi:hypothetical protein